jgi:hypothetical protein
MTGRLMKGWIFIGNMSNRMIPLRFARKIANPPRKITLAPIT